MSRYQALTNYLKKQGRIEIPVSFRQLEEILSHNLPASAKTHRAWWSNNPSNNVMTKAWLEAGYLTERVDMTGEKLVFVRKERSDAPSAAAPSSTAGSTPQAKSPPRALFGALRGTVIIHADVIEPADVQWDAAQGRL